jgi:hypothetical protein
MPPLTTLESDIEVTNFLGNTGKLHPLKIAETPVVVGWKIAGNPLISVFATG